MLNQAQKEPAFGNKEVITLLEKWLEKAKQGKINHVTLTACESPNLYGLDSAGAVDMEGVVLEALGRLSRHISEEIENRKVPIDRKITADFACYNLAKGPVSYDFFSWLIAMEMKRVKEKAPFPLKISFYKGADGRTGLESESRRRLFNAIVRPCMKLLGAVENPGVMGRVNEDYRLAQVAEAYRNGESVPIVKPSEELMKDMFENLRDAWESK